MENLNEKMLVDKIVAQQFADETNGYSKADVDAFLDEICDDLEALAESKTRVLPTIPTLPTLDSSELTKKDAEIARLQALVKTAQREVAEAKAKLELAPKNEMQIASEQATNLLVNAQKVYDKTIEDANAKASALLSSAQAEADSKIANLLQDKENLQQEVEQLKASLRLEIQKAEDAVNAQKNLLQTLKEKYQ